MSRGRPLPRLLAITPPEGGPLDGSMIEIWRAAGAVEMHLVVLLRDPASPLTDPLAPRLSGLFGACLRAGISVMLSCEAAALLGSSAAADRARSLLCEGSIRGVQLRAGPSERITEDVRRRLADASELWVGRSCSAITAPSPRSADGWRGAGADYVCVAPIFTPRTAQRGRPKVGAGLDILRRWTRAQGSHVIALGGIDRDNALACLGAGAHGLAGIQAFFGDHDRVLLDVRAIVEALRSPPRRSGR